MVASTSFVPVVERRWAARLGDPEGRGSRGARRLTRTAPGPVVDAAVRPVVEQESTWIPSVPSVNVADTSPTIVGKAAFNEIGEGRGEHERIRQVGGDAQGPPALMTASSSRVAWTVGLKTLTVTARGGGRAGRRRGIDRHGARRILHGIRHRRVTATPAELVMNRGAADDRVDLIGRDQHTKDPARENCGAVPVPRASPAPGRWAIYCRSDAGAAAREGEEASHRGPPPNKLVSFCAGVFQFWPGWALGSVLVNAGEGRHTMCDPRGLQPAPACCVLPVITSGVEGPEKPRYGRHNDDEGGCRGRQGASRITSATAEPGSGSAPLPRWPPAAVAASSITPG